MHTVTYDERRAQLESYFDGAAAQTWARLTSNAPVSRIRASVRAGRNRMRGQLLELLPTDLRGLRLLDAGCGTGALAIEAAQRGAEVVAIDVAPKLVALAVERRPANLAPGSVQFRVGDMADPLLGRFDFVVAMDSLIHYPARDVTRTLARLAARTDRGLLFTFAPRTAPLAAMHALGRLFPRGNRAPAIEPVRARHLLDRLAAEPGLEGWRPGRTARVASGFYTSQALELLRS